MQEFYESQKIENIKDYLSSQIYAEIPEEQYLSSQFIADQLQDYFIREETINWLDKFMDQLEHLERLEIIDSIQNHILELHKFLPEGEELFDVATIDSFLGEEQFVMYSSGLSTEYDVVNGGFGLEELIMLGGRRGSGKSIITLNTAKHQFEKNNNSVLFMSIEMRYVEVYYRLMSMLSGVSFMRFIKNDLNTADKLLLAKTKLETFYEATEEASQLYSDLVKTGNLKEFDYGLKTGKAKIGRAHV
jgi:replicative DNA helicase